MNLRVLLVNDFYYQLSAPRTLIKNKIESNYKFHLDIKAQTIYSLISPGTEIAAWEGLPPLRPSKQYPRLQGYCNVARITEVRKKDSVYSVGNIIYTHQSHRTFFEINEEDIICTYSDLSDEDIKKISSTYIFHLAYMALLNGEYFPGDKVAIIASGAIGYATAQLVKAFGGEPYIFSNHSEIESGMYVYSKDHNRLSQELESEFDIVINNSNSWDDHLLSMKLARIKGIIVLNGFPGRGLPASETNPLASQYMYDKQLKITYSGLVYEDDIAPSNIRYNLKRNMSYLSDLILKGKVRTDKLTSSIYSSNELADVYYKLEKREITDYSVVLKWC